MVKSILLWSAQTPKERTALEFARVFRPNRWLTYLIISRVIAAVTLLAVFFFAVFLGLVAVLAVVGLRLWWLRRKLPQDARLRRLETADRLVRAGNAPDERLVGYQNK